jgi:hypothetical protein
LCGDMAGPAIEGMQISRCSPQACNDYASNAAR